MVPTLAIAHVATPRPTRERITGDLIVIEGGAIASTELRRVTLADRLRLALYDLADWWDHHALAIKVISYAIGVILALLVIEWAISNAILLALPITHLPR